MCRFALYLGPDIPIASLVTEPVNSIIHQSFHAHLREEPLNGDGFGLAWYPQPGSTPALFKEVSPAWSNLNLRELARVTHSSAILAHVRAATLGLPVHQLNCHPFRHQELSFMHNGSLEGFSLGRRKLLAELSDEAFELIGGSTDSEHLFAIFVDALRGLEAKDHPRPQSLVLAMEATLRRAEAIRSAAIASLAEAAQSAEGSEPPLSLPPSRLNLVVSDGVHAVATRFVSPGKLSANSLYLQSGRSYVCEGGVCRMHASATAGRGAANALGDAILLASEPLSDEPSWESIEPGHLVIMKRGVPPTIRPLDERS